MREIWYLLKCPEGEEADCIERCLDLVTSERMEEIICFEYQCMMRYGGKWHLERRTVLPGYVFVAGVDVLAKTDYQGSAKNNWEVSVSPCEAPYLKKLCDDSYLIEISRGVIRKGIAIVTNGPLKGREKLIQRINRHKRTAEIEIPFAGSQRRITVGLEIYEKEM